MKQLKSLVILILVVAALAEWNVAKTKLKRGLRSSRLTKQWRQDTGFGFFKDVGTAGGNSLTKPRNAGCTLEGFFPLPGSCTDFIRCVDFLGTGKFFSVFKFNCPFGTVFDDDLDICNHPWAVTNPPECAGATANLPPPPGVDVSPVAPVPGPATPPIVSVPGPVIPPVVSFPGQVIPPATPSPVSVSPPGTKSPTAAGEIASPTDPTTEDTEPCNGTLAPYPIPQPTTLEPTTLQTATPQITTVMGVQETTFLSFVEPTTLPSLWEVDPSSIYQCPSPSYFPFEGDCVRFYKCVETIEGKLKGLLYKCPGGYGYSAERKRCWPLGQLPPCERRSPVPVERFESATQMYPEDLLWFFNNKK